MSDEWAAKGTSPPPMASTQFWLFLTTTVGVFTVPSLIRLSRGSPLGATMSDARLLGVVALELAIGLVWARRLASQGWSMASLTEPFFPHDLLRGAFLFTGAWVAYYLTFITVATLAPAFAEAARRVSITGHPSLPVVLLLALVNPIAEELLYLGVIAASLRREDPLLALSASVVARVCVHLYQGPLGVIGATPTGIVFGAYYLHTRRLWPVVATHGLMDLLALAALP